jgi:hypothetical protein
MQRSCVFSCQVQHFKDQDSKVRDACAEAMGVIAAEAFPADESGTDGSLNPLGVFFRPLFEAMGEQNRCHRLGFGSVELLTLWFGDFQILSLVAAGN